MKISRNDAQTAGLLLARGETVADIAENWGVSRHALYYALRRYNIPTQREKHSVEQLLAEQARSNIPPELYAWRIGIAPATLRRYAWAAKQKLAVNTYKERRAFWDQVLGDFTPDNIKGFLQRKDLPLQQVAEWYHRINKPEQLLLWGFADLRVVTSDMFSDWQRFTDVEGTFALGAGTDCTPVNSRLATEAFTHSHTYLS